MVSSRRAQSRSFLTMALVLGCAGMFALSVYHVYRTLHASYAMDAKSSEPATADTLPDPAAAMQKVIAANLFSVAQEQANAQAPTDPSLPELRGTFAGSGNAPSYAILAEPGQEEKSYKVGDHLPGGAEVARIDPDHVTLISGKTQHVVYLRPKP